MASNSTRIKLFILIPTVILIVLAVVFMDSIRLSLLVRDIISEQQDNWIDTHLLGDQLSFEQEEILMELISDPPLFNSLINRVYKLKDGNLEERHAAGVIAFMLASRKPGKETIDLMDSYLATPKLYDIIVGSDMLHMLVASDPKVAADHSKNESRIKGIEFGLDQLALTSSSTSAVLTMSRQFLTDGQN